MNVSVIIVSYNTCGLLVDCIESIYRQTCGVEFEIIVVDNDSKDDTCETVERMFPKIRLIKSAVNLGFGKANNLGADNARGKYLFFLNSDTVLRNNAIKMFFDFAESSGEKIGALGAILKAPDGGTCHSFGKFITMRSELHGVVAKYLRFLKDSNNSCPHPVSVPMAVDYITGADLFVPRAVYVELGGFDPAFFMYCEEVDWQRRMQEAGYVRLVINGPEIVHLEGGSDGSKSHIWSASRLKNISVSKRIYLQKYNKGIGYALFRVLYYLLKLPIVLMLIICKNGGGTERCSK